MSNPLSEYASRVPKAVRLAVDNLGSSDDRTYAVVMAIAEEGPLRFSEIEEKLDLHPEKLSTVLGRLVRGGLVAKRAGEPVGSQSTGAYATTDFGDAILQGLSRAVRRPSNREPVVPTEQYGGNLSEAHTHNSREFPGRNHTSTHTNEERAEAQMSPSVDLSELPIRAGDVGSRGEPSDSQKRHPAEDYAGRSNEEVVRGAQ